MNIIFIESDQWNVGDNPALTEGSTETFTATFWAAVTGTPTLEALKNGQSVTSTVFPSGFVTASGKTVTYKPAVFATHGNYVLVCTATIGTDTKVRKVLVQVQKKKAVR